MAARVVGLIGIIVVGLTVPAGALPPGTSVLPAPDAMADCTPSDQPLPEWAGKLTQPTDTPVEKFEHWLPRPDGPLLELTVYLPRAYAQPFPTVLYYTPYSSQILQVVGHEEADGTPLYREAGAFGSTNGFNRCQVGFFLRRGYAFVIADIRGTGDSTGCYDVGGPAEQADGRAIVDWIAGQAWSDGNVGMRGMSLEALSQFATAITAPPALKAIIPTSASDPHGNLRSGGLLSEPGPLFGPWVMPPLVRAGSTCNTEEVAHEYERHGWMDGWWQQRTMSRHADKISAAVLYAVGNPLDVTWGFGHMWNALERAGTPRKGLIGPWMHEYPTIGWWEHHELRWFEHHLKGIDTGVMAEPPLTLIDTAGNVTHVQRLERHAKVLSASTGTLVRNGLAGTATYTDRPETPRSVLEADPSAHLRYATEPMSRDMHLSGTPRLELVATIDRDDTNFIAVLYDVAPDGSRRFLSRGMLDAQLRGGLDRPPRPVPIGMPQRYTIPMFTGHHLIREGHRLLLVLSSSEACYDCGHPGVADYLPWPVVSDPLPAAVTVHEGRDQTQLMLPLAPAGSRTAGTAVE